MAILLQVLSGATMLVLTGLLAKARNCYIAGLITLSPTFMLIAHYIVASERNITALRATIISGMWANICCFIYLAAWWLLTGHLRLGLASGVLWLPGH